MENGWVLIGFLLLFVVLIVAGAISGRHRRNALQEWAEQVGLQYRSSADDYVLSRYGSFEPFGHGHSEEAEHFISGERRGIFWELFEYQYKTGSGDDESSHSYQIVAATVPYMLTRLRMRPEGLFDKIKGLMGFEDINFESEAFSRRYFVACSDRKFAYDLIHPQMIEYLLSLPVTDWQIAGNLILLYDSGSLRPIDLQRMMGMIEGFVERIPEFLRQDRALGVRSSLG